MGERTNAERWTERVVAGLTWASALAVVTVFGLIIGDVFFAGIGTLSWTFLTDSIADAGRGGGILPIIVSTLVVVGIAIVVATPIAVGTAVFLTEQTSASQRVVRRSLDLLAGVPSIVFGLFGNVFFCKVLGLGFSLLSGGLTLACMVLPILTRATEEGLRSVSVELRRAGAALGLSREAVIRSVVLPAATPGLIVGLVLGLGRAFAETAALIFTSGYVDRMPSSLWDSGRTLSVHIYDLAMNVPGGDANAAGSALVLLTLLLLLTTLASMAAQRLLGVRVTRMRWNR